MNHGHVYPNEDGSRARCGGPICCAQCASDLAKKTAAKALDLAIEQQRAHIITDLVRCGLMPRLPSAPFRFAVERSNYSAALSGASYP